MIFQSQIKVLALAGCTALLMGCNKQKFYYDAGPDVDPAETVSGTQWTSVMPAYLSNSRVMAMAPTSDDRLLLTFIKSGNVYGVYDGSELAISNQNLGSGNGFEKIEMVNNKPYGLGLMSTSGVYAFNIEDFYPWEAVDYLGTEAYAYAEYNGDKVVACEISPYIRISHNGGNYVSMGSGLNGSVSDLVNFNGKLIAAGSFTYSGSTSVKSVAQWDGNSWQPLGTGLGGTVRDLVVYNGKLVAAGTFNLSNDKRYVAIWDGSSWQPLGTGLEGGSNGAYKALVYGNDLVIGGHFDYGGSVYSPNVVKWNGSSWTALAGGTISPVGEMCIYKGKLHVANQFYSSGDNYLLRLD